MKQITHFYIRLKFKINGTVGHGQAFSQRYPALLRPYYFSLIRPISVNSWSNLFKLVVKSV